MKRIKTICSFVSLTLIVCLLSSCFGETAKKTTGKEVGKWKAEIKISDLYDSMADEDRYFLSMLAGNIMFEVDTEFCEDNGYSALAAFTMP